MSGYVTHSLWRSRLAKLGWQDHPDRPNRWVMPATGDDPVVELRNPAEGHWIISVTDEGRLLWSERTSRYTRVHELSQLWATDGPLLVQPPGAGHDMDDEAVAPWARESLMSALREHGPCSWDDLYAWASPDGSSLMPEMQRALQGMVDDGTVTRTEGRGLANPPLYTLAEKGQS